MWELKLRSIDPARVTEKGKNSPRRKNQLGLGPKANYGLSKSLPGREAELTVIESLKTIKGLNNKRIKEILNNCGISTKSIISSKANNLVRSTGASRLTEEGRALQAPRPVDGTGPRFINEIKGREALKLQGSGYGAGLEPDISININKRHLDKLYDYLTQLRREGKIDDSLEEKVKGNISRHLKVNSYKGIRHRRRYPQKGRTRSNARSRKRWVAI